MPTEITVWDVQHGNAITVKTPDGKYIWCDAGTGSYDSGNEFSPYKHMNNPQIDLLVLSHPHDDHVADFKNMYMEKVRNLLFNPFILKEYVDAISALEFEPFDKATRLIKYFNNQSRPQCGMVWNGASQDSLPLLVISYWVSRDIGDNLNNYSVVLFLITGKNIVCIPGDIEEDGWVTLMATYTYFGNLLTRTNILVASHHGRASGWYSGFAQQCNPALVIISDSDEKETSITSSYDNITTGHSVQRIVHTVAELLAPIPRQTKKCVSTRANGVIKLMLDENDFTAYVGKGI